MKNYINRKRFVVYTPNYKAAENGNDQVGLYKTLYSWFQVIKFCKKYGVGCEINVNRLRGGSRSGSLSYWNTEAQLDWV